MFLTRSEIYRKGITDFGENVLISDKCSIYGTDIHIGNNVRFDDFCILSGKITLGNNIHIGAFCALYGKFGIEMEDYTGLSPRCTVFSASDDFSGNYLISPMNPEKYTNVTGDKVILYKYVQIGAGTIIMPNVSIFEGAAIGAMSLVRQNHSIDKFQIWAGNPLKFIKYRTNKMVYMAEDIEDRLKYKEKYGYEL